MKYGLLILTFLFSINSQAIGECDNAATLKNLWVTKYSSVVQASASDFNSSYKIAQAICFLDKAQLPNFDFFSYLKKFIIAGLSIARNGQGNDDMARTNYERGGVELLPTYFNPDPYFDYKRASVLIHETRHLELKKRITENDNASHLTNSHVTCDHGVNKGNPSGCDPEFSDYWPDASTYSYEVLFFRKLFDYSPYDLNRTELAEWIVYLLKNSFNNVSVERYNKYTEGFDRYLKSDVIAYTP
jgi:hypothetical protein